MLSRLIIQSQPMISRALTGKTFQKIPIRNQIVRQIHNEGRDTMSRADRISHRQTLKEKLMAPAGPNGRLSGLYSGEMYSSKSLLSIRNRSWSINWRLSTWFGRVVLLRTWDEPGCINNHEQFNVNGFFIIWEKNLRSMDRSKCADFFKNLSKGFGHNTFENVSMIRIITSEAQWRSPRPAQLPCFAHLL